MRWPRAKPTLKLALLCNNARVGQSPAADLDKPQRREIGFMGLINRGDYGRLLGSILLGVCGRRGVPDVPFPV